MAIPDQDPRSRHPACPASRCQVRAMEQHRRGSILRGQFSPRRHAVPPPQSGVTGMSRTRCTTPATSPFRKITLASVTSRASLPGYAPSPTTYCVAISPQHSVRIDMLPLSPNPMRSSSGNSVESVEQPWESADRRALRDQEAVIADYRTHASGREIGGSRSPPRSAQLAACR